MKDLIHHEHTLLVLKELEKNPSTTQRYLSQELGISLGKVNFMLNALIEKGIIEAKNFKNAKHKLAYMYLLTPHGIKTKFNLTQQFIVWKTQQYDRLKAEIDDLKIEVSSFSYKKVT